MKLVRHLAGYLPVNIASGIAAFGGVYVFTRLLGAEDYGRYALMVSALALIHTLSLTWVEAANYRFTARAIELGREKEHFRATLSLMFRSLIMALLLTFGLWVFVKDDPSYARILPWMAALLPLNTIVQLALESHKASQRVGRYAIVESLRLLLGFAFGALVALIGGFGAAAPFVGLTVAAGLMALKEGPWLLDQARGGRKDRALNRAWLGYGIPIAAALVLDLLLSAADRFLIVLYLDEAAVGAYAAGYGVADKTVLLLCAWAAMAGSPLIMAAYETGGKDAARNEARGLIRTLLLIGMPAATGLALVASPLAEAMIGPDLREQAKTIIPWIAFAGLLNGLMIHYFSEAFQLAHRTSLRALLMIIPAGVNIMLNVILIPQFEIMGAVYATVISYALGNILLAGVGRRLVALPVPLRDVIRIGLACAAMWPVIAILPDLGGWAELILKAIAGGLTYAITAFMLDAGGARGFVRQFRNSSR